jgi:hypothetical protein
LNQTDTPSVKQDSKLLCSVALYRELGMLTVPKTMYERCIQDGVEVNLNLMFNMLFLVVCATLYIHKFCG